MNLMVLKELTVAVLVSIFFLPIRLFSQTTSVTSVTGVENGDILVRLSDHTRATYSVFDLETKKITPVSLIDDTSIAVVVHPKARKIVLVNVLTGEVVLKKSLNSRNYSQVQLVVDDLRNDGKYEAVVVSQRKSKKNKVQLFAIRSDETKLIFKDSLTYENAYVVPSEVAASSKSIYLNNQVGDHLTEVRINGRYHLKKLSSDLSSLIDLGDGKYNLEDPANGYIYLCQAQGGTGGATVEGDWIHGDEWNYLEKEVTVDGEVSWSNGFVTINTDDQERTIVSTGLPKEHTTGNFPISSSDDAYIYDQNPNSIGEQTYNLTLPANPEVADEVSCAGGEVGIALTGVAIFNGLDAENRDAVAREMQDEFGGHPEITGEYHYHWISDQVADLSDDGGEMNLVGYAFDGFGIFSEQEYGATLRTADLDECHGHTHDITWDGETVEMYHYHATKDFPYTVGCFKGEKALVRLTSHTLPFMGGPPPKH